MINEILMLGVVMIVLVSAYFSNIHYIKEKAKRTLTDYANIAESSVAEKKLFISSPKNNLEEESNVNILYHPDFSEVQHLSFLNKAIGEGFEGLKIPSTRNFGFCTLMIKNLEDFKKEATMESFASNLESVISRIKGDTNGIELKNKISNYRKNLENTVEIKSLTRNEVSSLIKYFKLYFIYKIYLEDSTAALKINYTDFMN